MTTAAGGGVTGTAKGTAATHGAGVTNGGGATAGAKVGGGSLTTTFTVGFGVGLFTTLTVGGGPWTSRLLLVQDLATCTSETVSSIDALQSVGTLQDSEPSPRAMHICTSSTTSSS